MSLRRIIRALLADESAKYSLSVAGDPDSRLTSQALRAATDTLARRLLDQGLPSLEGTVIGLALPPSVDFVVADFMALAHGAVTVPVPTEFTDRQIQSLLRTVDVCLVGDRFVATRLEPLVAAPVVNLNDATKSAKRIGTQKAQIPAGVVKIIHTSGSTNEPKGVLVTDEALGAMVAKLSGCLPQLGAIRYASVLPMSLLIEQILGLYLPIVTDGETILLPADLPAYSTAHVDASRFLEHLGRQAFNMSMLPPDLLTHLALASDECLLRHEAPLAKLLGGNAPLIATGGAAAPVHLIQRLTVHGFEVLQGYGLSENSSVVAWNTAGAHKPGSVGRPLPGVEVRLVDGELQVKSDTLALGYVQVSADPTALSRTADGFLKTGDAGFFDEDGYLFVTGRLKNTLALANSRKVCPEWIEGIYGECPGILHVVALGDGCERPRGVIVLVGRGEGATARLTADLARAGANLPSFAQLDRYVVIDDGEAFLRDCFTVTGRARRESVQDYVRQLEQKNPTLWHDIRKAP